MSHVLDTSHSNITRPLELSLQLGRERHAGGGVISPLLSQHDKPPSLHPRLLGFC